MNRLQDEGKDFPLAGAPQSLDQLGIYTPAAINDYGYLDPRKTSPYLYQSSPDQQQFALFAAFDSPPPAKTAGWQFPPGYNFSLENDTMINLENARTAKIADQPLPVGSVADLTKKIFITETITESDGFYKTQFSITNNSPHALFVVQIGFPGDIQEETVIINPGNWHSLTRPAAESGGYSYIQFNANADQQTVKACEQGQGACGPQVIQPGTALNGFEVWTKQRISYSTYATGDDQLNFYFLESRS